MRYSYFIRSFIIYIRAYSMGVNANYNSSFAALQCYHHASGLRAVNQRK